MMFPYGRWLLDKFRTPRPWQNRSGNTRAAAIVESRPDFFLKPVIRNVMAGLGTDWNLHVFCTTTVREFLLDEYPEGSIRYHLFPPEVQRLGTDATNQLLAMPQFWQEMPEDQVFFFQLDSLIVGRDISPFLGFDYIGAPCGTFDASFQVNGGSSLRSRDVMLQVCDRYTRRHNEPEDNFFTRGCRAMGVKMPTIEEACRFSLESIYTEHPFAVHGTDKYFHGLDVAERVVRDAFA